MTKDHMISQINYCVARDSRRNELYPLGLQAVISVFQDGEWIDPIQLNYLGSKTGSNQLCGIWYVEPGQQIDSLIIKMNTQSSTIQFFSMVAGLDWLMLGSPPPKNSLQSYEHKPTAST